MSEKNRAWLLESRPDSYFSKDNVKFETLPIPEPGNGEFLVRSIWISFDPTQLNWMKRDTYMEKMNIGEPVRSINVGQVVKSNNSKFKVDDIVTGMFGWQDYSISDGSYVDHVVPIPSVNPPWYSLSMFGITGMTAYFGVKEIGRVKEGERFVVSNAAGSVGSIAGQISKIIGARVVGIAGGQEKCNWVINELGFDDCIDYQTEDVAKRLSEIFPEGIDVYFDNVGGKILDDIIARIRINGRIILSGAISGYSSNNFHPLKNYPVLISRRARMEGFIVTDYYRRFEEAQKQLRDWVIEGRIRQKEQLFHGLEMAPDIFMNLFTGKSFGKQILQIADFPLTQ
ncbi:MAG: NADP-dependent oxidoreductase [Thermoplasmataceae archaeon]|jgi:NADPH-dependent curcumin reductase CurA